jgi:hypothetical protein
MLVGLGFSPKPARVALEASNGNVDRALHFLGAPEGQAKEKKRGQGPELYPNQVNASRSKKNEKKKDDTGKSSRYRSHGRSHTSGDGRRHHHQTRSHDSPPPEPAAPPAYQSFPGAYNEYDQCDPGDDIDEYDVEAITFNRDTNISSKVSDKSSASNTDSEDELIEAYVVQDDRHQHQAPPPYYYDRQQQAPPPYYYDSQQQAPPPYYYDRQQHAPPPLVPSVPTPVAQPETCEAPEKPKESQDANRNINIGGQQASANAQASSSSGRNHGDDDCWLVTVTINRYSLIACVVIWLVIIICFVVFGLTAETTTNPVTGEPETEPNASIYIAVAAIMILCVWGCICCCYHYDCDYGGGQSQAQSQSQSVVVNNIMPSSN